MDQKAKSNAYLGPAIKMKYLLIMILKSLSRRSGSTSQLVKYILRYVLEKEEKEKGSKQKEKPFIIRHNLRSRSIGEYLKEFEELEQLREHRYANSVSIYHHILSFSSKDTEHISDNLLRDIAAKFIELRGQDNLYIGTKHTDKDHIHLHLAMSAVDLAGRSARISKKDFEQLKLDLDTYQREHYPELKHSLPEHRRKSREVTRAAIIENIQSQRQSEKASLFQLLDKAYTRSKSLDQFLEQLTTQGCTPYYRAGTLTGITTESGRKYRFKGLGYDNEKLEQLSILEKQEQELQALHALRHQPTRDRSILQEVRHQEIALDPTEAKELEAIASIREQAQDNRSSREIEEPDNDNMTEEKDERTAEDDRSDIHSSDDRER